MFFAKSLESFIPIAKAESPDIITMVIIKNRVFGVISPKRVSTATAAPVLVRPIA